MRSAPIVWWLALLIAAPAAFAEPARDGREPRDTVVAQAERSQPGSGAAPAAPTPAPDSASEAAPTLPIYRLPAVGKPRDRVGGGRRGSVDGSSAVHALVPEHVGQTALAAPTLYWVLEGPAEPGAIFELTLLDDRAIEPVVETRIAGPVEPGLQRVRLADHGVALEAGVEYQWAVALVLDPDERSHDLVTTGWIERVASGAPATDVNEAAARGLWYDALDLARANAERSPAGVAQLHALLAQAGLSGVRLASR